MRHLLSDSSAPSNRRSRISSSGAPVPRQQDVDTEVYGSLAIHPRWPAGVKLNNYNHS